MLITVNIALVVIVVVLAVTALRYRTIVKRLRADLFVARYELLMADVMVAVKQHPVFTGDALPFETLMKGFLEGIVDMKPDFEPTVMNIRHEEGREWGYYHRDGSVNPQPEVGPTAEAKKVW